MMQHRPIRDPDLGICDWPLSFVVSVRDYKSVAHWGHPCEVRLDLVPMGSPTQGSEGKALHPMLHPICSLFCPFAVLARLELDILVMNNTTQG